MRYGEPTGRTILSAGALTIALLLGTASFVPAFAQNSLSSQNSQGAPSYTPGQTGGATDSTSRLPTMNPQNRDRLNLANPNLATGRPQDLGKSDETNVNSTTRNPPDPITDTGNDPGGHTQPATR